MLTHTFNTRSFGWGFFHFFFPSVGFPDLAAAVDCFDRLDIHDEEKYKTDELAFDYILTTPCRPSDGCGGEIPPILAHDDKTTVGK